MRKFASIVFGVALIPALCGAGEPGLHLKTDAEPFPTVKDLSLALPGDFGGMTFYGQNRFRWHSWNYFESEPFDNAYNYFANQLRLGSRLENSILKAHAAWQYAQTWLLPSGTSAGAGSGSLYFSNGTAQNETHGTYLKYAEIHSKDVTGLGITVGGGRMDYSSGNRYVTGSGKGVSKEDLAFSAQETVFAMLTEVSERAMAHCEKDELVLGGGVACNTRLQQMARIMCKERGARYFVPENQFLVDNGAMIAWLGVLKYKSLKGSTPPLNKIDMKPYERTDDIEVTWR